MSSSVLWNIGWRYLTRHPWQSFLMVIGITLGVAVAVAVDLANESASRAFDLSTEAVAGKATHFIASGPLGLDESIYAELIRSGLPYPIAPVVSDYVSSPQLGGGLMQLLGVDPFSERPFRDYLGTTQGSNIENVGDLLGFLTQPEAIFLSVVTAERYDIQIGDRIDLDLGGQQKSVRVIGLLQPSDRLSQRALDNLILVDISTAQELTGNLGRLDRLDLILPELKTEKAVEHINSLLPKGTLVLPIDARSGTVKQMADAFRVNLTALSLLALVVGLFLIYNTITFSVIQRRPLFGTLRCLGVTRREVFLLVVIEAFLVGIAGSGLGLITGILMGQAAVQLVTRTINDLFFVVSVQGVQIPVNSLIKGVLLGIFATVLTAAPPAWEAASVPPRVALSRSGLEQKAQGVVSVAAISGIVCLFGGIVLLLQVSNLWVSFLGTFTVIAGFALLAPIVTIMLTRFLGPITGFLGGALGRMSLRNVENSISRTSVAVSALMVAVSVTIGVSLMVSSFRHTVKIWLDQVLQGDVYISAPSLLATQSSASIDPSIVEFLNNWPDVNRVYTLRAVTVDSPNGPVQINASSNPQVSTERLYLSQSYPSSELEARMMDGAIVVSEPFANRLGLSSEIHI